MVSIKKMFALRDSVRTYIEMRIMSIHMIVIKYYIRNLKTVCHCHKCVYKILNLNRNLFPSILMVVRTPVDLVSNKTDVIIITLTKRHTNAQVPY